jgi:hypothetical protein
MMMMMMMMMMIVEMCKRHTHVGPIITCVASNIFPSSNDDIISSYLFYDPVNISSSISSVA